MQINAVGGDDASRTNTPLSALSFILESAVLTAESWVNGLELETFPRDAEDWGQISAHPSISGGWRWENWDDFIVDLNHCDFIEYAARGCSEVEALRTRFEHAMMLIRAFADAAGAHVCEFCR